ncbi:MAG TPA: hypothetical protein DDZ66_05230 [Firmicutes bacterium]|nr:hypothetical protein [Bacillota bacterium]
MEHINDLFQGFPGIIRQSGVGWVLNIYWDAGGIENQIHDSSAFSCCSATPKIDDRLAPIDLYSFSRVKSERNEGFRRLIL